MLINESGAFFAKKKEPTSVFNAGIVIEDIKHAKRDSVVFSFIHDSRNCTEVAHALETSAD
jgi:hypothetical protein